MPAAVADPKRSLDSEQISPATIAHHTVYEKAPNLHQSHICQWGAQPYLVGPLSRLVGKPPFSPWLSECFAFEKGCKWPKQRHIIDADIRPHFILCLQQSVFWGTKSKKRRSGNITSTLYRAVLMGTKSCTKILILPKIFPTRFRFTFYG